MDNTPTSPLRFQFRWDEKEYRKLYTAVARHRDRSGNRGRFWLFSLLFAVGILAALIGLRPNLGRVLLWWFGLAAVVWLLGRLSPRLAARNFRRSNCCVRHPMERMLDAEGVHANCETTYSLVRWPGLRKAVETPDFFLFYVTPACAQYLPKRAFTSELEADAVRSLVREKLGQKAYLLDP